MKKILIILATITFIFALVISVVPEISQTNSSQNNNIAYAIAPCMDWEYHYKQGHNYVTNKECFVYIGGEWEFYGYEKWCNWDDQSYCEEWLCQEQYPNCKTLAPK